jgi:hypothetical protein
LDIEYVTLPTKKKHMGNQKNTPDDELGRHMYTRASTAQKMAGAQFRKI